MRRAWVTWTAVAGLWGDAIAAFVISPLIEFLQMADDAHDVDPEGDEQ